MADSNLLLTLEFPEGFLKELDKVIEDELTVAQKKWRIKLSKPEQAIVRKNAYAQTRLKASSIAKHQWNLEEKIILKVPYTKRSNITLSQDKPVKKDINFTLTKDGWVIANEEAEYPIPLADLLEKQMTTILTWARTAVFYGVGSYRTN